MPKSEFYDIPEHDSYIIEIDFKPEFFYQAEVWHNGDNWQVQETVTQRLVF